MLIVPPGSGIVHQVNLEYLARVVFTSKGGSILYPDTVVSILSLESFANGYPIMLLRLARILTPQ